MTREEARKAAEVMLAYANGEEIEVLSFGEYEPCKSPSFNWVDGRGLRNYRVKPKPTYRPFKDKEECWNEMLKHQPFGWIRDNIKYYFTLNDVGIWLSGKVIYTFRESIDKFAFADGTPFGIKEE